MHVRLAYSQVEIEKLNQLLKIKDYELWEDLVRFF